MLTPKLIITSTAKTIPKITWLRLTRQSMINPSITHFKTTRESPMSRCDDDGAHQIDQTMMSNSGNPIPNEICIILPVEKVKHQYERMIIPNSSKIKDSATFILFNIFIECPYVLLYIFLDTLVQQPFSQES